MSAYLDTSQNRPIDEWPRPLRQPTGLEQPPLRNSEFWSLDHRLGKLSAQCDRLAEELRKVKTSLSVAVKIQLIAGRTLTTPLDVIVEPDDEGFIARCVDLPLFGYGDDQYEAVECLRKEIDSLYHDLIQDEDATEEWLQIRRFFEKNVT